MTRAINKETRSRMMAAIRGRDTKPEMRVRRHLHSHGFRYRVAPHGLPSRPDIVLRKWNTVIFVHGCFWRAHDGCSNFNVPATRTEFWLEKFSRNRARDQAAINTLRQLGWRVAIVWECCLRVQPERTLNALTEFIRSERPFAEFGANDLREEPPHKP
jgi:DNA mismatch endonuclease (patch repair protein)